jgi:serine protease inhibitor
MDKTDGLGVWQGRTFTLVELPYGTERTYSMYIVLPDARKGSMQELEKSFDPEQLQTAISKLKYMETRLLLPVEGHP